MSLCVKPGPYSPQRERRAPCGRPRPRPASQSAPGAAAGRGHNHPLVQSRRRVLRHLPVSAPARVSLRVDQSSGRRTRRRRRDRKERSAKTTSQDLLRVPVPCLSLTALSWWSNEAARVVLTLTPGKLLLFMRLSSRSPLAVTLYFNSYRALKKLKMSTMKTSSSANSVTREMCKCVLTLCVQHARKRAASGIITRLLRFLFLSKKKKKKWTVAS